MEHKGTKQIETNRLVLRKFKMEDAESVFRNWASDHKVTTYLRWPPHASVKVTENILQEWITSYERDNFYQWSIVLKDIDESIGSISVVEQKEALDIVHIGYCIGSTWWNQGITTEAFQAIIPFLFDEVKVNRIESQHDPKNPNSGKVMKACSLTYEGTLREADISNQGIVDASIYALLAKDYHKTK
ncbi:MAG: GNAT family N-acetyltransferase [Longicatena sp.]